MNRAVRRAAFLAAAAAVLFAAGVQAAPVRVCRSVDMEGIAGVVTSDQLGPERFEYARFREFMMEETLAAIDGARAAGATEFVVSDSHGNGESLLIDKFPKDLQIVRAWPRPFAMMQGIDDSFAAAIFAGLRIPFREDHDPGRRVRADPRDLSRAKARASIARRAEIRPWIVNTPVEVEIRFKNYRPAEVLTYLSVVERIVDAHAIRFRARDMVEAPRFLEFVTNYEPGLAP
ncbi:MAG: M55 family metallopeptidase [Thermoanaerobaculia bacterium]